MLGSIVRRFLWLPILLAIIVFITFSLGFYGPGGPEVVLLGQRYDPETAERIREEWGMNDPFFVQYFRYLRNYASLNFGESLLVRPAYPVRDLILQDRFIRFSRNNGNTLISDSTGVVIVTPQGETVWDKRMTGVGRALRF